MALDGISVVALATLMTMRYIRSSMVSATGAKVFWGGCWFSGVILVVGFAFLRGWGGASHKKTGGYLIYLALGSKNEDCLIHESSPSFCVHFPLSGSRRCRRRWRRRATPRVFPLRFARHHLSDLVVRFGGPRCRGTSGIAWAGYPSRALRVSGGSGSARSVRLQKTAEDHINCPYHSLVH